MVTRNRADWEARITRPARAEKEGGSPARGLSEWTLLPLHLVRAQMLTAHSHRSCVKDLVALHPPQCRVKKKRLGHQLVAGSGDLTGKKMLNHWGMYA